MNRIKVRTIESVSQKPATIPPFPIVRSYIRLIASIVIGVALGLFITIGLGHGQWVLPMVCSAIVCLIASLVAMEPIRIVSKWGVEKIAPAYLIGIVIRGGLSLAGACMLVFGYGMPSRETGVFTAVWYVLLLAVEVMILVRFFNTATVDPTRRPELMES
ncbi:hypothetical protein [Poriferisphaera corsica]|nr:hypothetical protein [Poriferisphaera corsica]